MKNLFFGVLFLLFSTPSFSQTWSPEQLEVWAHVQNFWDSSDDPDKFMSFFHEDYAGWSFDSPVPGNKTSTSKYIKYFFSMRTVEIQNIEPLKINVVGDVAVVHYYFDQVLKYGDEMKTEKGRWTDIYKKINGKWMLIGDSGGEME